MKPEEVVYKFVQSVIQQTQRHMQTQIEQCIQQTCSGLTLGTPVCVREYTEQFCKSNKGLILMASKCIEPDPYVEHDDWNDKHTALACW